MKHPRTLLLITLLLLTFMFGRQSWTVAASQSQATISADTQEMVRGDVDQYAKPLENIRAEISKLRILAWTCPLLLRCSPWAALDALSFLSLEDERYRNFQDSTRLALQMATVGVADSESLKFEFQEKAVDYRHLLHQIAAAQSGVPSEIANALEPIR